MLRSACTRFRHLSSYRTATTKAKSLLSIPLDQPLPGFEKTLENVPITASKPSSTNPFDAEMTILPNGLRVVSQPSHGDFITIGVAIESGCRYEAEHPKGVSHFLEKLAFASSARRTSEEIFSAIDNSSALLDCQSLRDTTIYASSCHRSGVSDILEIIADAALRPQLLDEEMEAASATIIHENADMKVKIEAAEPMVTDWLHQAAFKNNTLGFSRFTSDAAAQSIKRGDVLKYQRSLHVPNRMVVSGVGVDHADLVSLAGAFFVANTDVTPSDVMPVDSSHCQYTGGEVRAQADLSQVGAGTPYPLLAHVALAFEGASYKDEDFVTFCVLQSLLGGGNSFSAGGPGKGMFTRMYVDVLNHHHWMYGCQAFNHSYADGGLFAIHASCPPEGLGVALQVILDQMLRIPEGAEKGELARAKTQLKSQLLMNLEVRPVMFEDMARQVIGHGYRRMPGDYMAQIDGVTVSDIIRVGERMLASRPSLVGYGDISHLQPYAQLDEAIARRDVGLLAPARK